MKWKMKFNVVKGMRGKNNPNYMYTMIGCKYAQERDLELTVESSVKTSTQCSEAVKKAIELKELLGKEKRTKQRSFSCYYVNAHYACISDAVHSLSHPRSKKKIVTGPGEIQEKGKKNPTKNQEIKNRKTN